MAQITSGKVSYGRTVKTGDYESKRCDVELAFSVSEGEDFTATFDLTCRQVIRRFNEMTGAKDTIPEFAGASVEQVVQTPTKAPKPEAPASTVAEAAPKKGPGRPKKEKLEPKPEPEVEAAEDKKADECVAGLEEPVTDAEIREACTRAAPKIGPDKVKAIRNTFKVMQVIELPQDQRRAFLKAIEDATLEAANI